MTVQINDTVRNGMLNAIETGGGASAALKVFTGAQPAATTDANSGTDLVTINLPADWANDAATGAKTLKGTWSGTASAGAASTPGHFRLYTDQSTMDGTTCFMQGSCGVGGGDLSFDGTITSGQTVTISTFTLTEGSS